MDWQFDGEDIIAACRTAFDDAKGGAHNMRRPFIVMEANPKKFPNANHAGARALSDFLLSPKVQTLLAEFGQKTTGRGPLFHPVEAVAGQK